MQILGTSAREKQVEQNLYGDHGNVNVNTKDVIASELSAGLLNRNIFVRFKIC